jgi:hypothetical protein
MAEKPGKIPAKEQVYKPPYRRCNLNHNLISDNK